MAPLIPLISRAVIQRDLGKKVSMEIKGPEEAKRPSLRTLCRGRCQPPWAQIITFVVFWRGAVKDRSPSNGNVRSHQMVGGLVCECIHI